MVQHVMLITLLLHEEDGEGAARAMLLAIKEGGISPEEVDYVNAHGTVHL